MLRNIARSTLKQKGEQISLFDKSNKSFAVIAKETP